jgi:hypothetical protein
VQVFVEWCFQRADIDLVAAETLPAYDEGELKERFCSEIELEEFRAQLREMGLTGESPWQILLPAYQMKAFQKPRERLPHTGMKTDHPWPD